MRFKPSRRLATRRGGQVSGRRATAVSSVQSARVAYPPPPYPEGIKQRQIKRGGFALTTARHPIIALPGLHFYDPEERRLAFPEKVAVVRAARLEG